MLRGQQKREPVGSGKENASAADGETSSGGIFAPAGVAQRIQAAAHGAIGSLPRNLRQRAVNLWNAATLQRLTEAMGVWIRGADLEAEQFARLFFDREADDPGVSRLRDAALNLSTATDHAQLGSGAEHLAAALQVIGLDRWPGFLAEVSDRAADPATVAAVDDSRPEDVPGPTASPGGEPSLVGAADIQLSSTTEPDFDGAGRPEQLPMPGQAGAGAHSRTWALPPPGITPPVRNPQGLNAGSASRPSQTTGGGQSLWDENGGEWRYYPADTWNRSSWDYNEHVGPNSPWRTVPAGRLP